MIESISHTSCKKSKYILDSDLYVFNKLLTVEEFCQIIPYYHKPVDILASIEYVSNI